MSASPDTTKNSNDKPVSLVYKLKEEDVENLTTNNIDEPAKKDKRSVDKSGKKDPKKIMLSNGDCNAPPKKDKSSEDKMKGKFNGY